MKSIIATIVTSANERHWPDFEIPADIPTHQAAAAVANALRGEVSTAEHVQFLFEVKIAEGLWQPLEGSKSLAQLDITDAAYLRVQKSFSTSPDLKPLDGWRSLFDSFVAFEHRADEEEEAPVHGYVWKLLD